MNSITTIILKMWGGGGSEGGLHIAWSSAKPNVGAGKHIHVKDYNLKI